MSVTVGLTIGMAKDALLQQRCLAIRSWVPFTPHCRLEIARSFHTQHCNFMITCLSAITCGHLTRAFGWRAVAERVFWDGVFRGEVSFGEVAHGDLLEGAAFWNEGFSKRDLPP